METNKKSRRNIITAFAVGSMIAVLFVLLTNTNNNLPNLQGEIMGAGSSAQSSGPDCSAQQADFLRAYTALSSKINYINSKVSLINDLEREKNRMIASGTLGSHFAATFIQYQINTAVEQRDAARAALPALQAAYDAALAARDACLGI